MRDVSTGDFKSKITFAVAFNVTIYACSYVLPVRYILDAAYILLTVVLTYIVTTVSPIVFVETRSSVFSSNTRTPADVVVVDKV